MSDEHVHIVRVDAGGSGRTMKISEAWNALTKGDGITDGTFHAVVDGGVPQLRVHGQYQTPATFDRVEDLVEACKDVSRETGSKWRKW